MTLVYTEGMTDREHEEWLEDRNARRAAAKKNSSKPPIPPRRRMIRKGKMAMTATSMVVYGAAKRRDFLLSAIEQCGQKLDAFEVNSMTEVGVQTRSDFGTQCA